MDGVVVLDCNTLVLPKQKYGLASLKQILVSISEKESEIAKMEKDAGIPALMEKIEALQGQIEDKKKEVGITILESEIQVLRQDFAEKQEEIGASIIEWGYDKFTKGKCDLYVEDGLRMRRSADTKREIKANEFFKAYPDLKDKIAKVTLKDAKEQKISEAEINRFCIVKTKYTYNFVTGPD